MKKVKNIEIRKLNGKAIMQPDGKTMKLVDIAIIALEQGKDLGFKVYKTGQKLIAMQEVNAPELILEDAELDGVKRAIKKGTFLDFVQEQAEEALDAATEHKIEVK